jgi:hypothetical protein
MAWLSPDGTVKYTHGPDCDTGPNCCCGVCGFINIASDCGNTVCCKCIPKWLCMVFIPDEITEACVVRETTAEYTGSWVGSLPGIDTVGTDHRIEVLMLRIDDGPCMFRVYIPARDITEDYVIDGGKRECSLYPEFRQTCQDPYFELTDFTLNGCTGTLVIRRKELEKVPFSSPKLGTETSVLPLGEEPCGPCTEYCRTLCLEWSVGGVTSKAQFTTGDSSPTPLWGHRMADGTPATITVEEIDGVCHLVIDHDGLGEFDKVPIPYQMCNLGMVIEYQGTGEAAGKWVSISCNRCTCWDYICDMCRCVCQTMCVVSVDGPEQTDVTYYELEWDERLLRWGTAEKWVGLRGNPDTGKCEYVISGWNDDPELPPYDTDASTIEIEECGKDMSYYVTSDMETAFETGVFKFEYGICKTCNPDCFKLFCDDCCDECDVPIMPEILFFDLVGSPIAGDPPEAPRCLAIYDIPLIHTQPLFAESHRWEGHVIAECSCPLSTPSGPNKVRIDIRITCGGAGDWTINAGIRTENGDGDGDTTESNDPIKTTSFSCSPVSWLGKFSPDLNVGGLSPNCCCDGVFEFDFAVSE